MELRVLASKLDKMIAHFKFFMLRTIDKSKCTVHIVNVLH